MPRTSSSTASRHPQVASVIWGWRLELAMFLGAVSVLKAAELVGPGGPLLVAGLCGITLWVRPQLRRGIGRRLRIARLERVLSSAMRRCQVVGRDGRIPRILRSRWCPEGLTFLIRLPAGMHTGSLTTRLPELASALGVRAVRLSPLAHNAGVAELVLVTKDLLAIPLTGSPLIDQSHVSLWEPIPLGIREDGEVITVTLSEHNLLIGGEPGSGKSVALSSIVAAGALDPTVTLTLLDGKQVELQAWKPTAERFVGPNLREAIEALGALQLDMDQRYEALANAGRRKIERDQETGLRLVVVDELALYLRGGPKQLHDRLGELLRDLVARGRAAGVIVVASTQKPSHDTVPTWIRDLFSYRLALRCTSSDASDTILGAGWATKGYSAASIDPALRGVGYLLAEGGFPQRFRATHLSDIDVAVLAHRAEMLRGGW